MICDLMSPGALLGVETRCAKKNGHTVDGSEIRQTRQLRFGRISHYSQGFFIHMRWEFSRRISEASTVGRLLLLGGGNKKWRMIRKMNIPCETWSLDLRGWRPWGEKMGVLGFWKKDWWLTPAMEKAGRFVCTRLYTYRTEIYIYIYMYCIVYKCHIFKLQLFVSYQAVCRICLG